MKTEMMMVKKSTYDWFQMELHNYNKKSVNYVGASEFIEILLLHHGQVGLNKEE